MAEFASAIIGLIAVGIQTSKSLHSLIETYKDAPTEILALSDEVTAFRTMLSHLKEVDELEEWTLQEHADAKSCLDELSKNGKHVAQEIEELISRVQKGDLEIGGKSQTNKLRWLRIARRARKLQESLRNQRIILCNLIAVRTLKCSARHGLQVTGLKVQIDTMIKNQLTLMENQNKLMQKHTNTENLHDNVSILSYDTDQQTISSKWSATVSHKTASPPSHSLKTSLSCHRPQPYTEKNALPFTFSEVPSATSLSCLQDCKCQCHFRSVVRSPKLLSNCLGNIVLGFFNLPWAVSPLSQCDEQTCRRMRSPKTEIKYFVPSWFSHAVANFQLDLAVQFLPLNISIRTLNTISYDSPIFVCTQEGDLEGIMKLFQSGSASLYDVDPYGLGLLYYASYYCWRSSGKEVAVRTCQFLLDLGADMDLEDEKGCTPLDTLIGDTLISLSMREHGPRVPNSSDFEHISKLFGRSSFDIVADYLKASNFATIHKVLLGIQEGYEALFDYLKEFKSSSPSISTIDIPDSTGRSALAWAVEYGWTVATKALLQYGANPNQLARSSGAASPLLHLAIAMPVSANIDNGSLGVVKELLKAGADINAVDHENWTPLHVAASWNNYDIIQELATFGGETLEWDLVTNDNQSAMDLSLNSGINHQVQSILKSHNRVSKHIYGRGHRDNDGDLESKEEQFFDSEETWCCA